MVLVVNGSRLGFLGERLWRYEDRAIDPMLVYPALALLLSGLPVDVHAGENDLTTFKLIDRPGHHELFWQDAEDVVRGTITPRPTRSGGELTVSLFVGSVQGAPFEGPVTIALRPLEAMGGTEAATVTRGKDDKTWVRRFTPTEPGPHRLEVSFRTTHLKVVRGVLPVEEAPLPRWLLSAIGLGLIAVAVGLGTWWTLSRREAPA
jgi:hypothetical protein